MHAQHSQALTIKVALLSVEEEREREGKKKRKKKPDPLSASCNPRDSETGASSVVRLGYNKSSVMFMTYKSSRWAESEKQSVPEYKPYNGAI